MDILLIEDDLRMAELISIGLRDNGHSVRLATDGIDGYIQYIAIHPDMIITDIMLPGSNGIDLCKKIKEQDYFIPIIMLTALGTTNEKVEGFDAGADDYMVKPFEMKELLARIKALHKRSQYAPHENILKVEDLEVNLKTKQVIRAGHTIDLTPKEFNLLTYMLNNKGRVLSKSEIAEKVWDTKFDTGTNFIDVYISYLRRKIDKDYSKKLIQTKNGMGYILISHENPD